MEIAEEIAKEQYKLSNTELVETLIRIREKL